MAKKISDSNSAYDPLARLKAHAAEAKAKGRAFGTRSGSEIFIPDIISTGSYIFDNVLGGGFRGASWARFVAEPESGKTSMSLCWGKQWQDFYKKQGKIGCVVYYNAEGRITEELIRSSGIDNQEPHFIIVDTNNAEFIWDDIAQNIFENDDDIRYFFIVDSTDALVREVDADKSFGESDKMSGVAAILSSAGKKLSLPFNRHNHFLYMCSQVRDNLKSQHGGKKPSGGWSPQFYSSLVAEIKKPNDFDETWIYENPSNKKSERIGRFAHFNLLKTPNKKTGQQVLVPIKEDIIGGVWKAMEAIMEGQSYGLINVAAGGRYSLSDPFAGLIKEAGFDFETKWHGEKVIREYFDAQKELVDFTLDKVKERVALLRS